MKTYLSRFIRYIIRMVVLLGLVIGIMALTGTLNLENGSVTDLLFRTRNGLILIAIIVIWSAAYPLWSFAKVDVRADLAENREEIENAFSQLGYSRAGEKDGKMVFRASSPSRRFLMQWDDAVTVTSEGRYIELEGLKKIVTRVKLRIDSALQR